MIVYNWTLNASGGRITIDGCDASGRPVKVVGVKSVRNEVEEGLFRHRRRCVARDASGKRLAELR